MKMKETVSVAPSIFYVRKLFRLCDIMTFVITIHYDIKWNLYTFTLTLTSTM